jgi:hypothetical protein
MSCSMRRRIPWPAGLAAWLLVQQPAGAHRLFEGAFVVARGRVAQQEATGSKLFIDDIVNLYPGAWASALVISIHESSDASSATDRRAG